jgi:hypothetical protein
MPIASGTDPIMRLLSYLFRDHGGKPLAERPRYCLPTFEKLFF